MKVKVVITEDGSIAVATQEGSFLEGKARIEALLKLLGQNGLPVLAGEVETHRHSEEELARQHGHTHGGHN